MKKRTLTILLSVACLSLVVVFSAGFAQEEPVVIHPLRWDASQTVYSNQEIIFVMGWGTCHRGLVQSYLTAVNMAFILDGEALFASKADANQYWGSAYETPAGPGAATCLGKTPETIWRADWAYSYGSLEPGDYTLYFAHQVDHPVTDAADYDGDGKPDIFKGLLSEREFTIHVEHPAGD